jgi:hypothetical protein
LEPFFIAEFFNELESEWHLYKDIGNHHQIQFNRSLIRPLLTNGWAGLREFHRWRGNIKICFFYYGNNNFQINIFNENIQPRQFPSFHSLSSVMCHDHSFEICVSQSNITTSELISISK